MRAGAGRDPDGLTTVVRGSLLSPALNATPNGFSRSDSITPPRRLGGDGRGVFHHTVRTVTVPYQLRKNKVLCQVSFDLAVLFVLHIFRTYMLIRIKLSRIISP